jgi:hypothetical protein
LMAVRRWFDSCGPDSTRHRPNRKHHHGQEKRAGNTGEVVSIRQNLKTPGERMRGWCMRRYLDRIWLKVMVAAA